MLLLRLCGLLGCAAAAPPPDASQVVKYFEQYITFAEAENFTAQGGAEWAPKPWAHSDSYFAATIANTFHSRRAHLRGPAGAAAGGVAAASVTIGQADTYHVLVRYEAPYRFDVPFLVTVKQQGRVLLRKEYGWRATPKLWPFGGTRMGCGGPGLVAECAWPYGATENMVWEGVNETVALAAGAAEVSFTATGNASCAACLFANRNIDLVMLSPNASDLALRMATETKILPLDGLLSQAGEVFVKLTNHDAENNVTVPVPLAYIHSPYFGQHLYLNRSIRPGGCLEFDPKRKKCKKSAPSGIFVAPGATTDWIDVGVMLDCINHGTWNWPRGNYSFTVGAPAKSFDHAARPAIEPLVDGVFDGRRNDTSVLFDASIRATRRVRHVGADLDAILASFAAQGQPPVRSGVAFRAIGSPENGAERRARRTSLPPPPGAASGPAAGGDARLRGELLADAARRQRRWLRQEERGLPAAAGPGLPREGRGVLRGVLDLQRELQRRRFGLPARAPRRALRGEPRRRGPGARGQGPPHYPGGLPGRAAAARLAAGGRGLRGLARLQHDRVHQRHGRRHPAGQAALVPLGDVPERCRHRRLPEPDGPGARGPGGQHHRGREHVADRPHCRPPRRQDLLPRLLHRLCLPSEKDAKLAQKLGQLQM
jgi:hypothetical protein